MALTRSDVPYLTNNWSVISGCNGPVDPETGRQARCPWCYLAAMRQRFGQSMDPVFRADRLADPLRCRKPAIIGLLGGDLFDPVYSDEQIAAAYGVMAATPQHIYIIPTKQAERMDAWFSWATDQGAGLLFGSGETLPESGTPIPSACAIFCDDFGLDMLTMLRAAIRSPWPLPNVWQGVSVTNQRDADQRIESMLCTPAAHRFVSIAPMRGPVDIGRALKRGIDAVILEGQGGPQAVPLDLEWVRLIRDQCQAAGVAFAFKQGSGLHPEHEPELDGVRWPISGLPWMRSRA